jgi:arylsulfatase A-like enzyme
MLVIEVIVGFGLLILLVVCVAIVQRPTLDLSMRDLDGRSPNQPSQIYNWRRLQAWMLGLALGLSLGNPMTTANETVRTEERPPNVVLILADDLGVGDVSTFQKGHIPTPNIDQLGVTGVRFTDAHVSAAVCMPSRAGLITGRQGTRHGSEFNAGPGLSVDETNIAELLKTVGYRTGIIGKWHLGARDGRDPLSQGFDEFFGLFGGATSYIDVNDPQAVNGFAAPVPNGDPKAPKRELFRGREPVEESNYLTDALTREAVSFIDRNRTTPFFLYLAYNAPHTPHQTIRKYYDRFAHIADHDARVYASMVSAVDDGVGAVVEKIQKEGLESNTLIIFLSDNGGPNLFTGGPSNASYSGWKRYHLEGGHRTPLFLSWPGKISAGRVDERLTSSLDLFPTIAAAAGVKRSEQDKPLDGVSLLPYLEGTRADAPHEFLYWRAGANYAVRDGRWKLIVVNRAPVEQFLEVNRSDAAGLLRNGPYQGVSPLGQATLLYDLANDVGESKNVADQHPDIVERLQSKYEAWNRQNVSANAKSSRSIPTVIDGTVVQLAF